MVAKINKLSGLLNKHLTMSQRGILITILMLRDTDPYITLAKVKREINMAANRADLIYLHEKFYIEWSGYRAAKKASDTIAQNPDVIEVMRYLNALYPKNFNASIDSNVSLLRARLKEYSVDDIKLVISNRYLEWKDDSFMSKYLQPQTIFRPKHFAKYLAEAEYSKKGQGLVEVAKIKLEIGQEITYDIAQKLPKNDLYTIRVYSLADGAKVGTGRVEKKYGKDLLVSLNISRQTIERGDSINAMYFYEGEN